MEQPYDWINAVEASRQASEAQDAAEQFLLEKGEEFAAAEREYRKGLSRKIVNLREQGVPATVAADLARGDEVVAALKCERDIAEALKDAAQQSIFRHTANRRDLLQLLDWSKRAAFLDLEPVR